jgi:hypothetical protein
MAEVFHRYLGKDGKLPKLSAQERKEAARRNKLATELTDERAQAVRVNRMRSETLLAKARGELIAKGSGRKAGGLSAGCNAAENSFASADLLPPAAEH